MVFFHCHVSLQEPSHLECPESLEHPWDLNNTRVFYPTKTQRMVTQKRIYDFSEMLFSTQNHQFSDQITQMGKGGVSEFHKKE